MTSFFRFDEFEVDGEALELRREGERTSATPQAVRALLLLLRSAGRLVTREELYAELWPTKGVDVDRGLNTTIRHLRAAMGDDAARPTYIRTYPGRGYRFLRGVSPADAPITAPRTAAPRRTSILAAALAALAVGLGGVATWWAVHPPASGRALRHDSEDPAAALTGPVRERFLEGRYLVGLPQPGRRGEAVPAFQAVVEAEPDFAPGHAWLSEAALWAGQLEEARAAAERALSLDRKQTRALITRGTVRLVRDWDPTSAMADLREAVRLSPKEPAPHHALSFALATLGRHQEAVRGLETAHGLDPVSSVVTGDLGLIHLYAGDLGNAVEYCTRAFELEPAAAWAVGCAFDALVQLGSAARARPLAMRLVLSVGESVEGVLGPPSTPDQAAVRRFHDWRADRAGTALERGESAWRAAVAMAVAGRLDEAVSALHHARGERGLGYVTLTIDPRLRPLRRDPRFRALADELWKHGFARLPV